MTQKQGSNLAAISMVIVAASVLIDRKILKAGWQRNTATIAAVITGLDGSRRALGMFK